MEPLADVDARPNLLLHEPPPSLALNRLPTGSPAGGTLCGDSARGSLSQRSGSPHKGAGGRFATSRLKRLRFGSHARPPWAPSKLRAWTAQRKIGRFGMCTTRPAFYG